MSIIELFLMFQLVIIHRLSGASTAGRVSFRIAGMPHEWTRDAFTVTTDPARLDLDAVHAFLVTAYWCEGIPREVLARAAAGSLCFSLLERDRGQIGLARVVS